MAGSVHTWNAKSTQFICRFTLLYFVSLFYFTFPALFRILQSVIYVHGYLVAYYVAILRESNSGNFGVASVWGGL